MPTKKEQEIEIERMRVCLHELVRVKVGNMIDPEVSNLSTKLDKLIVKYQISKDENSK